MMRFTALHSASLTACLGLSLLTAGAVPVAVDDTFSTSEDTAVSGGVMTNDAAPGHLAPAAGLVTPPAHGVVSLQPDGSFTYTPAANFFGTDGFTYKVYGDRAPVTMTIDPAYSRLTLGGTLRVDLAGIPSVSNDSDSSSVTGSLVARLAPASAPFAVAQASELTAVTADSLNLDFGVLCVPFLGCLAGVKTDIEAGGLTLSMLQAGPAVAVWPNGGFDQDGNLFQTTGSATTQGYGTISEIDLGALLPPTVLPLNLPVLPMPLNGKVIESGGQARMDLLINYKASVAFGTAGSIAFSLNGTLRATASLPLPSVEESGLATVTITILPINDAPLGAADNYTLRANTPLSVSAAGNVIVESLVGGSSSWHYLHNGVDQGVAWRSWMFNHTAWSAGNAELGYGDASFFGGNRPEATNIRPSGTPARPTAYFRRDFTVVNPLSTRSLSLEILRDDGAAVYLNGVEVARQNLATAAGYTTLALTRIPNMDETRFFPESVSPSLLLEGRNTLAVEVHQFSTSDSILPLDPADVSFDCKLSREAGLTGPLVNDLDVDSPAFTATLHTGPTHGSVTIAPDGAFTYTPDAGFTGTDTFYYQLHDGGAEAAHPAFIPSGAVWKYLDNGSDLGTAWRVPAYDDTGWASGAAELGYGDNNTVDDRPETTVINSGPAGDWPITTYFRKAFTLATPQAAIQSLTLRLQVDDAVVVYLNGTEIARDNLPASPAYDTGAILPIEGELEIRWQSFPVPAGLLVPGRNVLAVELHQHAIFGGDASFDLELLAATVPGGMVTLNVAADDFDQDGISDTWERAHQLNFAIPDAGADPDGDGVSNFLEYLADTHPLNRADFFTCQALRNTAGLPIVRIPVTSSARRYHLRHSETLQNWLPLPGAALPGTGGPLDLPMPDSAPRYYYQAVVELP